MSGKQEVTAWLLAWSEGDETALHELVPRVYQDLHRLASSFLARERPDPLLQPTALVHEAFLRLVDQRRVRWRNRAHFFALAAKQMRRILVDWARRRRAEKRGGHLTLIVLEEGEEPPAPQPLDFDALESALAALESFAPRQGRIVELRFFGGLTIAETAEVLQVSPATIKLDWQLARAWLLRELSPTGKAPPGAPLSGGSPAGGAGPPA